MAHRGCDYNYLFDTPYNILFTSSLWCRPKTRKYQLSSNLPRQVQIIVYNDLNLDSYALSICLGTWGPK